MFVRYVWCINYYLLYLYVKSEGGGYGKVNEKKNGFLFWKIILFFFFFEKKFGFLFYVV